MARPWVPCPQASGPADALPDERRRGQILDRRAGRFEQGDLVRPAPARDLAAAKRPQFVYWLTLNSHLPVLPDPTLGTEPCTIGPADWREELPEICRLFAVHRALADAIDQLAMDPALPPTDFLIVGDHVPAFFHREHRLRFDPNRVPWFLLRARDAADTTGA